jgi:hypothetical protein
MVVDGSACDLFIIDVAGQSRRKYVVIVGKDQQESIDVIGVFNGDIVCKGCFGQHEITGAGHRINHNGSQCKMWSYECGGGRKGGGLCVRSAYLRRNQILSAIDIVEFLVLQTSDSVSAGACQARSENG